MSIRTYIKIMIFIAAIGIAAAMNGYKRSGVTTVIASSFLIVLTLNKVK